MRHFILRLHKPVLLLLLYFRNSSLFCLSLIGSHVDTANNVVRSPIVANSVFLLRVAFVGLNRIFAMLVAIFVICFIFSQQ